MSGNNFDKSMVQAKSAFKMAIAAGLCLVIARELHWNSPFYAVIASIIVMSTTYASTFNLGVQRVMGTVIGCIGGAIFSLVSGSNFLSLGICVFLTTFLASWKFQEVSKMAGFTSVVVMLNHGGSPWLYAWERFWETLLGIGVALLVNFFIFPAKAGQELRKCLAKTLQDLEELYGLVIEGALTGNYDRPSAEALKIQIISSFGTGRVLWKEVRGGQSGERPGKQVNDSWELWLHRLWEHILTMEHTVLARQESESWLRLAPNLTHLSHATSNAFLELATSVKKGVGHLPLPGLNDALTENDREFESLKDFERGKQSLDDLLRFISFFYTMEEVGRKLLKMSLKLDSA